MCWKIRCDGKFCKNLEFWREAYRQGPCDILLTGLRWTLSILAVHSKHEQNAGLLIRVFFLLERTRAWSPGGDHINCKKKTVYKSIICWHFIEHIFPHTTLPSNKPKQSAHQLTNMWNSKTEDFFHIQMNEKKMPDNYRKLPAICHLT